MEWRIPIQHPLGLDPTSDVQRRPCDSREPRFARKSGPPLLASSLLLSTVEWEEWDKAGVIYINEGSLGGYVGGDEGSWTGHSLHPARFGQDGSRGVGTRVSTQFQGGSLVSMHCPLFKRWPPYRCACFPEETEIPHVRRLSPPSPSRQNRPDGSRSTMVPWGDG